MDVLASSILRMDANWVDYLLIAHLLRLRARHRRHRPSASVSSSIDFFLSGRSLPAWVTGLAFISANLGAVEIMGMSANGAAVRHPDRALLLDRRDPGDAVPRRRDDAVLLRLQGPLGPGVHAPPVRHRRPPGQRASASRVAQLLIAGINLYLLGHASCNALLGWPLWVSLLVAAAIVLSYITLGGLSAAIYNEVLQFFVIVAALLPLTLSACTRSAAAAASRTRSAGCADGADQLNVLAGHQPDRHRQPVLSVVGIVFGLGFVLSFGYWTTNFVEVQRAMASQTRSRRRSARRSSASFPKMFIPFIVIIPGMIAAVARHRDRRRPKAVGRRRRRLQRLAAAT